MHIRPETENGSSKILTVSIHIVQGTRRRVQATERISNASDVRAHDLAKRKGVSKNYTKDRSWSATTIRSTTPTHGPSDSSLQQPKTNDQYTHESRSRSLPTAYQTRPDQARNALVMPEPQNQSPSQRTSERDRYVCLGRAHVGANDAAHDNAA